MADYNLFGRKKDKNKDILLYKKEEKVNVPMFSDFFSNIGDDLFCTNAMYASFKDNIISTIDVYNPKTKVVLSIYERNVSSEDKRGFIEIGFKNYINACYKKVWLGALNHFLQVLFFCLVGVGMIILGYGLQPLISLWLDYVIINFGSVLIWQLVGYLAFEYAGQKKEILRLKQLEAIEFEFKKWE